MRFTEWTHSAKKYFSKLPSKIQRQIAKQVMDLSVDPFKDTVLLKEWEGIRRARAGDWRILFRVSEETIRIIAIGPRGDIYK